MKREFTLEQRHAQDLIMAVARHYGVSYTKALWHVATERKELCGVTKLDDGEMAKLIALFTLKVIRIDQQERSHD